MTCIYCRDAGCSNCPASTAELLAKGGQTNMLEDRRLSLVHNPTEPFTMPLDASNLPPPPPSPSLPTLPRRCEFQRRVLENNRVWKILDWEPGTLHMWGTDYEEFETGPGMHPIGVVEDSTGYMHAITVERIRVCMKIEPLGDWKFKMTSKSGEETFGQIGNGKISFQSQPSPPRACWFKVASEWFPGTLHMWGMDGTDLGSYPIGVVEDETGKVHSMPVENIKLEVT